MQKEFQIFSYPEWKACSLWEEVSIELLEFIKDVFSFLLHRSQSSMLIISLSYRRKSKQEVRQGFGDDLTPEQTEAVNHLKAMFPDRSMEVLQGALEARGWNVEEAVDHVIDSCM